MRASATSTSALWRRSFVADDGRERHGGSTALLPKQGLLIDPRQQALAPPGLSPQPSPPQTPHAFGQHADPSLAVMPPTCPHSPLFDRDAGGCSHRSWSGGITRRAHRHQRTLGTPSHVWYFLSVPSAARSDSMSVLPTCHGFLHPTQWKSSGQPEPFSYGRRFHCISCQSLTCGWASMSAPRSRTLAGGIMSLSSACSVHKAGANWTSPALRSGGGC
mmetsp:Transcript_19974/g.59192  ORF Transcript_19974/g.59192 Transcript_19974/m.59192 type:complete len:218 (+) Transcript_19974:145-798(+)